LEKKEKPLFLNIHHLLSSAEFIEAFKEKNYELTEQILQKSVCFP